MPDRRRHRGPHPEDARLFAGDRAGPLRAAVRDLSWLLSRGYAERSAVKLVGDRYRLRQRQRVAVMRSACGDSARDARRARELGADALGGRALDLDGYNVLTSVEAALAGGVLLLARDGCLRDMASMHGHYRRVEETAVAVDLIGRTLVDLGAGAVTWTRTTDGPPPYVPGPPEPDPHANRRHAVPCIACPAGRSAGRPGRQRGHPRG
jgi:hypothetical protein